MPRFRPLFTTTVWTALAVLVLPAHAADPSSGGATYQRLCAQCHGSRGVPVLPVAPDFSAPTALMKGDGALLAVIRDGRGAMPAYQGQLKERDMLDVVAHLRTLRGRR
ncbi:c-type cytochrome [Sphaerotilus mobilis]|uniref:Cbb3-type cytochrome c oxidase subunit III n=1 Tax=Sphaerotilus mobilis TaxID=47994 RepID=A0A4V2EX38_9BURK|nr:cytochrome c [Sphaerotilus mobilis]RZS58140.1 cbb3-type cytochrome c oxidase subunit III [Sphaerotilus mobilis]